MIEVWYNSNDRGWEYIMTGSLDQVVDYFSAFSRTPEWHNWMVFEPLDISRIVEDARSTV